VWNYTYVLRRVGPLVRVNLNFWDSLWYQVYLACLSFISMDYRGNGYPESVYTAFLPLRSLKGNNKIFNYIIRQFDIVMLRSHNPTDPTLLGENLRIYEYTLHFPACHIIALGTISGQTLATFPCNVVNMMYFEVNLSWHHHNSSNHIIRYTMCSSVIC